MKKPILLLGFEPFSTFTRNPSAELVNHLVKDPEHEAQVFAAVLPVSFFLFLDVFVAITTTHTTKAARRENERMDRSNLRSCATRLRRLC